MKKTIISLFSTALLLAFFVSCNEDLEKINENPNSATIESVPAFGVFNGANKFLMDASRGSFSSGRMALPWMQYSAQRNYTEEDRFQFRTNVNQNLFRDYYLIAQDYKVIIMGNTDPELKIQNAKYGNNDNQIAAARVMLAYTFLQLVDSYGDVPYYSYGNKDPDFQALDLTGNFLKPKFAKQQKIYADLMKELKEAAAMIVINEPVFTKGDRLFGGSALKLKKFANSLRLRIATRVNGVVPGAAIHISEAIAGGVMTSNADNVGLKYENNTVNPSPFYSDFYISNRTDFAISNTLVDLLKGKFPGFPLDPRLQKFAAPITASKTAVKDKTYTETSDITQYVGMPYGITSAMAAGQRTGTSFWSYNVLSADYTEIFMEYAEVEFLLSENDNWNVANYKKGIAASMSRWGVSAANITNYTAAITTTSKREVLTQKYIGLFMQPYEAWAEHRRTGFPDTLLKPGGTYTLNKPLATGETTYVFTGLNGLTIMPTRFQYPVNLAQLNGANYDEASASMGGDLLTSKLIWDKN